MRQRSVRPSHGVLQCGVHGLLVPDGDLRDGLCRPGDDAHSANAAVEPRAAPHRLRSGVTRLSRDSAHFFSATVNKSEHNKQWQTKT
mgnify:CR=1 FL=1